MINANPKSTYAGHTMTLDELIEARSTIEEWANEKYALRNAKLYRDICHVCTLAQGMWYQGMRKEG